MERESGPQESRKLTEESKNLRRPDCLTCVSVCMKLSVGVWERLREPHETLSAKKTSKVYKERPSKCATASLLIENIHFLQSVDVLVQKC